MNLFVKLSLLVSGLLLGACGSERLPQVGMAEVDYTPEVGKDLVGNYRGDDYASRGKHDPLYARAFVMQGPDGNKAAVLSVDICWMRRATVDMMRSYIAERSDLRPEQILIASTHTHSGPKSLLDAPGAVEYLQRAADAVLQANADLKPARLRFGSTREDSVAYNRRLVCRDGKIHMSWENPDPDFVVGEAGPIDTELSVLSIDQVGGVRGAVVNYGCHATTLSGNNWLYSADYPGYMASSLKASEGADFVPVYLNAPCGNATQVNYRRGYIDTYEECEAVGNRVADAARRAMSASCKVEGAEVAVIRRFVPVKRIAISEEQYAWARRVMERVAREGMPPFQLNGMPDEYYAQEWIGMYATQQERDSLEVMVCRVGDVAVVGLPGEFFSEFRRMIREQSPFPHTLVVGIANDNRKYFPTKASFEQGGTGYLPMAHGYETTPGTTLYEVGAGEQLASVAVELLNLLKN